MIRHLVSRSLLKRFANRRNGPISGLDLDTLKQRTDKVKNFGGILDVDLEAPNEAEKTWSKEVESPLRHALQLLDEGKLLSDAAAVATIKKCIALHWSRGFAAKHTLDTILVPNTVKEATAAVLEHFTPAEALYALTGTRSSNLQLLHESIHVEFTEKLRRERFLDTAFNDLYEKGQTFLETKSLEIWCSLEDEFLIGDIPVVTHEKGTGKVGILDEVSWRKADAIFMPLGPRHVVAISKKPAYFKADSRMVERLNVYQVRAALKEVYFRPESGLGDVIANALKKNMTKP